MSSPPRRRSSASSTTSSALDALLGSDSEPPSSDPALSAIRAARLKELSRSAEAAQPRTIAANSPGHGTLAVLHEKEAIATTAAAGAALLMFSHPDMATCASMRKYLETISRRRPEVCCVVVQAEECAWLCGKMGVKVLPVVVGLVGGKEMGRVLGFEGIRGGAQGGAEAVERAMATWGLWARKVEESGDGDDEQERQDGMEEGRRRTGTTVRKSIRDGGVRVAPGRMDEANEDDDWD